MLKCQAKVNFVGPDDQWVVSGSDDGNFFIWDKKSEKLCGIYEGDSAVVNVIEGHPHFPLLAISGIDTSIKVSTIQCPPSIPLQADHLCEVVRSQLLRKE